MNINLDEKRIRKIIYTLEDGTVVAYNFKNGDIWCVKELGKIDKDWKTALTDQEMIDSIRNSKFMDELEDARKRFKISNEIAETFPQKDKDSGQEKVNRKYSDESFKATSELIKMDKEGKLDEILRKTHKNIDEYIKHDTELEDEYDARECGRNIRNIEEKILARLRNVDNIENDKEFNNLIDGYKFYKSKKKELDDKIWNEKYKE
jgi:hypothetical protein